MADISISVPSPLLSSLSGTPSACVLCCVPCGSYLVFFVVAITRVLLMDLSVPGCVLCPTDLSNTRTVL